MRILDSVSIRPKTSESPEAIVCRILMCMWPSVPLPICAHYEFRLEPSPAAHPRKVAARATNSSQVAEELVVEHRSQRSKSDSLGIRPWALGCQSKKLGAVYRARSLHDLCRWLA